MNRLSSRFMAKVSSVSTFFTKMTSPKAPDPMYRMFLKSDFWTDVPFLFICKPGPSV